MNLAELRAALDAVKARMTALHTEIGEAEPTDEQAVLWTSLEEEARSAQEAVDKAAAEATDAEKREQEKTEAEARRKRVQEARARWGGTNVQPSTSNDSELRFANVMAVSEPAVRSALMRAMEGRLADFPAETGQKFERVVRGLVRRTGSAGFEYQARTWQQKLLVRASDEYGAAFAKYISGNGLALSPEEARAIAVGTNTSGGYLVPTFLDPTIILTTDGGTDVVRPLSQAGGGVKVMLPGTGNVWQGVTSAGVTGSWDAEGSEVSDDTPSFANKTVTIGMGRVWAEATFQALININGIESELYSLFAEERDRMESVAHCTGAGTNGSPTGVEAAVKAVTACRIVSTTAAQIGVVDINAVNRDLGQRWRRRASWLMSPLYADAVQALGTAVGVAYTGTIAEDYGSTLKNRPWVVSDDMPDTQTTTALDSEIVFGDFGKYVLVDRPGTMAVEFIPNMVGSNGRPISTRGWLMWWEHGGDVIVPSAFRILQDKTSA